MNVKLEIIKDVMAVASILVKFDCDDILESQSRFVRFLANAGFQTPDGNPITLMTFRNMIGTLNSAERKYLFDDYDIDRMQTIYSTMYQN